MIVCVFIEKPLWEFLFPEAMASQTQGIQQLLGAEKRAAEKVQSISQRKEQSENIVRICLGEWSKKEKEQEVEAGQRGGEKKTSEV